jgi:hypothetical protein
MITDMKLATRLVLFSFLLPVFAPSSSASDDSHLPSGASAPVKFSPDDFDWREMVPYLLAAAALPGEQGIKAILENSSVLRAYVANEAGAECRPDKDPCAQKGDGSVLDAEVSKRIAEIVEEGIFHKHKTAIVDYPLAHQPFPFSEVAALKDENHPDAHLILQFADRSYKAWQIEAKYGPPYDTNIFQWYSIFIYRLDSPSYISKAVFEVDPVDGAVIKVAISLRGKKPKNRH